MDIEGQTDCPETQLPDGPDRYKELSCPSGKNSHFLGNLDKKEGKTQMKGHNKRKTVSMLNENKKLARLMAAKDVKRHLELARQAGAPIASHWEPVPDFPGEDGTSMVVSSVIGCRGSLTRQEARIAAKSWRRYVKRYPKVLSVLSLAGYDEDPRNIWEIEEATTYVRWWAHFAGLNGLADASRYLDETCTSHCSQLAAPSAQM